MSVACSVCNSFHGHVDEAHFDYAEAKIHTLEQKVNYLTEVIVAYAMDKPTVAIEAINKIMDMDNE